MTRSLSFLALVACFVTARATAQTASAARVAVSDTTCSYSACALSLVPAWDGLRIVRGSTGQRVDNLHFFWPIDVGDVLRGPDASTPGADSAAAHAQRALDLRRVGAGFTDAGALALGVAVLRAIGAGHMSKRDQVIAGTGLGALIISVPLQFAADGELSRAVWWHNLRYARPPASAVVALGSAEVTQQRAVSLVGTWEIEYTLDSAGAQTPPPTVGRVRGRLMFGDAPSSGMAALGRFAIDFAPMFGRPLGRDSASAASPADSSMVSEVSGTFAAGDSVHIELVPRILRGGLSMSGRIQGDSASGTWIQRCCGAQGHFRMTRIDRVPMVLVPR